MKNKVYRLKLSGDEIAVTFLKGRVPEQWKHLGPMREAARAIELLFPKVKAECISVTKPSAERVKSL